MQIPELQTYPDWHVTKLQSQAPIKYPTTPAWQASQVQLKGFHSPLLVYPQYELELTGGVDMIFGHELYIGL